jgi:SAM-dependent methyltransferase
MPNSTGRQITALPDCDRHPLPSHESATAPCHLCEAGSVTTIPAFAQLMRVSSDHFTWPSGGRLGVCDRCGGAQKLIDDLWRNEIKSIYDNYLIYHQSGGIEQATFNHELGQELTRSARLLRRLVAEFPLGTTGRLLDIGCGNGALLRAFAEIAPRWSSAGTEWDDKCRAAVESIPGAVELFTVPPDRVPGQFDLVTMVHVLEHVPLPRHFLSGIRDKLRPGGLFLVHLPDHRQNPFELTIADHASHFAPETAAALLESSGYEVVAIEDGWVPRELSLVARVAAVPKAPTVTPMPTVTRRRIEVLVGWLQSVAAAARDASRTSESFGLFGTSTAATWLTSELGSCVEYYIDEDANRVGRTHLNRPIYSPGQAPPGGCVFVALPTSLAGSVALRLGDSRVRFVPPPDCPPLR